MLFRSVQLLTREFSTDKSAKDEAKQFTVRREDRKEKKNDRRAVTPGDKIARSGGPKILGKIDLDNPGAGIKTNAEPEHKPAQAAESKPESKPEPDSVSQPKPEPKPEPEQEPASEPKSGSVPAKDSEAKDDKGMKEVAAANKEADRKSVV